MWGGWWRRRACGGVVVAEVEVAVGGGSGGGGVRMGVAHGLMEPRKVAAEKVRAPSLEVP